tara:strand:- start:524 stop:955 length:432 start_codon:yes stop_codon:yes gene_type:complete
MKIIGNHFSQIKIKNINFFFCLKICTILFIFFISEINPAEAQEYATDRMFIKQYKRTKCRNEAEKIIRKMKKIPKMTLEQEVLLIQNIWVKTRSNLPLTQGEKRLLKNLKEKGVSLKKRRSREIQQHNAAQFNEIRMKCKQNH